MTATEVSSTARLTEEAATSPPHEPDAITAALERAAAAAGEVGGQGSPYDLARGLLEAERLAEALAIYDERLTADPHDARALDGRGVVLDLMGRHGEAQEAYRAALEVRPDSLPTRNNLGLSLALGGRTSEAIALLREVASHPDAVARHRQNLALAYGLAGYDEAAAAIAGVDLDDRAVAENLDYYRLVRNLREEAPLPTVTGSPGHP